MKVIQVNECNIYYLTYIGHYHIYYVETFLGKYVLSILWQKSVKFLYFEIIGTILGDDSGILVVIRQNKCPKSNASNSVGLKFQFSFRYPSFMQ